jgi:hypothetical protein
MKIFEEEIQIHLDGQFQLKDVPVFNKEDFTITEKDIQ